MCDARATTRAPDIPAEVPRLRRRVLVLLNIHDRVRGRVRGELEVAAAVVVYSGGSVAAPLTFPTFPFAGLCVAAGEMNASVSRLQTPRPAAGVAAAATAATVAAAAAWRPTAESHATTVCRAHIGVPRRDVGATLEEQFATLYIYVYLSVVWDGEGWNRGREIWRRKGSERKHGQGAMQPATARFLHSVFTLHSLSIRAEAVSVCLLARFPPCNRDLATVLYRGPFGLRSYIFESCLERGFASSDVSAQSMNPSPCAMRRWYI